MILLYGIVILLSTSCAPTFESAKDMRVGETYPIIAKNHTDCTLEVENIITRMPLRPDDENADNTMTWVKMEDAEICGILKCQKSAKTPPNGRVVCLPLDQLMALPQSKEQKNASGN